MLAAQVACKAPAGYLDGGDEKDDARREFGESGQVGGDGDVWRYQGLNDGRDWPGFGARAVLDVRLELRDEVGVDDLAQTGEDEFRAEGGLDEGAGGQGGVAAAGQSRRGVQGVHVPEPLFRRKRPLFRMFPKIV